MQRESYCPAVPDSLLSLGPLERGRTRVVLDHDRPAASSILGRRGTDRRLRARRAGVGRQLRCLSSIVLRLAAERPDPFVTATMLSPARSRAPSVTTRPARAPYPSPALAAPSPPAVAERPMPAWPIRGGPAAAGAAFGRRAPLSLALSRAFARRPPARAAEAGGPLTGLPVRGGAGARPARRASSGRGRLSRLGIAHSSGASRAAAGV